MKSSRTSSLIQDIRYTGRLIAGSPGYAAIIVLAVALGVGATSLVFSLVNSVILRPLPYKDSAKIAVIHGVYHEDIDPPTSPPDFLDWRNQNHVFEQIAAYASTRVNIDGIDHPESVPAAVVSYNLFKLLGIDPIVGQGFKPEDDKPGMGAYALIGYDLWRRTFGSDQGIIGRSLTLNGIPRTVIGVMPPGLKFPKDEEIWFPIGFDPQAANRMAHFLHVVGRLKPGVDIKSAQAEMKVIADGLAEKYPDTNRGRSTNVTFLYDDILGDAHLALLVLFGAVCFVLLIACANVANLMLAKASGREREMAVRIALGAGRGRLVQQLLTESVVLSFLGGVLGLVLMVLGIRSIIRIAPSGLPRLDQVGIDWRVVALTVGVSLLTGVLFGMAPALQSSKVDVNSSLKEGARGSKGESSLYRSGLVVAEIALALILLTGAGLMIKSFSKLQNVNPGFNTEGTTVADMILAPAKYSSGEKILGFYQTLVKGISSKPEVESVGAVSDLPLTGDDDRLHFTVEGAPALAPADRPIVQIRSIIGAYFHAMRIPLNAGREFVEEDGPNSPKIAIINQTLADNFFQGQDPLGKHITLQFETEPRQIVGVVGNVRVDDLDVAVRPQAYVPLSQSPSSYMGLVVHGNSSTVDLRPTIRLGVSAIDSQQPIYNVRTLDEILQRSVSQKRFTMLVMAFLAGMAGILAAIGIYGVMSHSVSRRTGEIGIRMALGADPSQVRQMVLGRAVALTAIGVFGGVVGSLALGGVISSMLSHVSSSDPIVMSMVCLGAIAVALLASYLPARKATRVDPMLALRKE